MEKNIKIIHNGGGWITNIGNAFLDYGSIESIKQACQTVEIHLTSVLNRWVSYQIKKGLVGRLLNKNPDMSHVLNLQDLSEIDYIVQSGACLGPDWFNLHGDILQKSSEKGIKIIINGGGMTDNTYSDDEIVSTRKILKKLKPFIFISRDEESYKNFYDLAEHSYNGIDVAFFLKDAYKPQKVNTKPYVILNFDKDIEPSLDNLGIDQKYAIIRTHHSFWHNFSFDKYLSMKKMYYEKNNTMISEIPEDYLALYANTNATYSDRVHACVATISYGNPARLVSNSPRSLLFERMKMIDITKKILYPTIKKIQDEKDKQIKFLSDIIA